MTYDPAVTCLPLVMACFVEAQKLMKLFDDVKEATWPASATAWPFCSKPVAITLGSSAAEASIFWTGRDDGVRTGRVLNITTSRGGSSSGIRALSEENGENSEGDSEEFHYGIRRKL